MVPGSTDRGGEAGLLDFLRGLAGAGEEIVDPTADTQLEVQPPRTPSQAVAEEDRQLKKAIEILKDPARAPRRAA